MRIDFVSASKILQCKFWTPVGLLVIFGFFSVIREGYGCKLNWLRYGDYCFRFYPVEIRGHMSRLICMLEGSDLASISSSSALDFIQQHAAHEAGGDRYWVGLVVDSDTGHLRWLDDASDPEKESFVRAPTLRRNMHPDNSSRYWYPRTGECFAFNGEYVARISCDESSGAICGYRIGSEENLTACDGKVDPKHSFTGEATGNCLFKAPQRTRKDKAEELCQENGGHFVDIDDMIKDGLTAFYDHQVLANDGSKYWTGFTWNGTDVFWRFGNAVSRDYPISVIGGSGRCITVQFNFTDILQTHFYQTECDEEANVVCSHGVDSSTAGLSKLAQEMPQMDSPELKCPEGYNWKMHRTNSYCYWETSYETDHLSWADAENYCQSYGGHLASFHSAEEERFGLSFQYGSLAHPYWIGLSLDVETETYRWSDGSPLDYTNWAPGHPNHRDKRLKCVAMEAQQKHWKSSLCGILSWFICKVPKKPYHVTRARPTPTPLESCDKVVKGSKSSYRFQGECYTAVSEIFSWHRAKQYCENEGASLVSFHSEEEIGFLLRLLQDAPMERNRIWIGLNSLGSDGAFQWTDWSPLDFTFFSDKVSNDTEYYHEKCYYMDARTGLWNKENCNADAGLVCKWANETRRIVPSTADPRIGNCKKGWIAHEDRCYYFVGKREKDRVNWTTATSVCRDEGGYLTSVRSEIDQNFLSYMLQSLGVDVWIGFHDTIQSGKYFWVDNSEVRYTNWAVGEPSFFGITEDCVKMVYDHLDSGVWKDDDCDHKYGYICQSQRDPELPKPSYEQSTNCLQPEGWSRLDNMCFKMFAGNSLPGDEAERACQKEGGHLVSVSDQRVKAAVSYLAQEVNQPFFIGLQYKKETQQFSWLNNYPVLLTNWEKNEPSFIDEETCFASTSEGYWKKTSCDEQMPFMCQISSGKIKKPNQYKGNCPTSTSLWTPGSGNFCYILVTVHRLDWFTSNLMCFRYGTHLVSIHSKDEIDDLKKLMETGGRSVFIGLMRNKKGGFMWTDDTPVDFVNWDEGEPANADDQCVEMMPDTMKWRVTNCILKRWYICMDRKDTLQEVEVEVETAEHSKKVQAQMVLSPGAIIAILLTAVVVFVVVIAAVFYHRTGSKKTQCKREFRDCSISFENALYRAGSGNMEFRQEDGDSL